MSIMTKEQLFETFKQYPDFISPFNEEQCKGASYDFRLGEVLKAGASQDTLVNLESIGEVTLEGGDWALLKSYESLNLPNNVCVVSGLRHSIATLGLICFGGIQVDPCYKGNIFLGVYNPTMGAVRLKFKESIFSLTFHKLSSTSAPYEGKHQEFRTFLPEQVVRMCTTEVKQLKTISNDLESINCLLKDINNKLSFYDTQFSSLKKDEVDVLLKKISQIEEKIQGSYFTLQNMLIVALISAITGIIIAFVNKFI
jgi:dCTP deaminase